ncbi:polysaccharide deacetylase family protein [Bacillus massilinigeriensis]|uniref:polysaccharide deacetylase family protein n=1 Tax=Bacillus mediterraneensis TaxID=1805474 RepID=UPI0008F92315|nr:polysaccharide deacetylase family protein [Bacillus mediterraneensis]
MGGIIGLICYFFFHWFYNLGLKKENRDQDQVFLDPAKSRWSIIKRMSVGFAILMVIIALFFNQSLNTKPAVPSLALKEKTAKSGIQPVNARISEKAFPSQTVKKENMGRLEDKQIESKQEVYGFYVNWDNNSKSSFKKNVKSITTLVPEWLQVNPDLSLKANTDIEMKGIAQRHDVKVLPLVNNFVNNKWDGEILHRLFTTPGAEDRFIKDMLTFVQANHFDGINIDFEEVHPKDRNQFTEFMKKTYAAFHQNGLAVTVDLPPGNNSFDYPSIAANADRVFIMLYDQHYSTSTPGPIASTDWVKNKLSKLNIPSEKLVVSLGNYGYKWEENSKKPAEAMTFRDVMELSRKNNIPIYWHQQSGNPYFRYKKDRKNYTVWFLDAASFYNQMRLGIDSGSKGVAIWRLGSEDPAVWKFINKPKEFKDPSGALTSLASPNPVNSTGEGEVLQITAPLKAGKRTVELDSNSMVQKLSYDKLPNPLEIVRHGKSNKKEIVLTFDDGPDPAYTPKILDILKKNDIKGSFFIVGKNALMHPELVKRMHKEGHEIGNHTYSHPDIASSTPYQTRMELNATQRLFQGITGHSMTLFRPPYVAEANPQTNKELVPIIRAQEMGYTMVGKQIDTDDWKGISKNKVVNRVLSQLENGNVILMHDSGGDRSSTVEALSLIISELKARGYTFTTIGGLLGKSEKEVMPAVSKDSPFLIYDKAVFMAMKGWHSGLNLLFYSAIFLGILRLIVFVFLSWRQRKRYQETVIDPNFTPFVSVVIAAYNEEKVICKTINSILANTYKNLEILVVDDGSKDETAAIVEAAYVNQPLVRLIKKANGGKSSAVNLGFHQAKGEIVVALDADTLIAEDAISLLVNHFKHQNVAAVSGNVKVGNKRNLLTKWQHIEYVTGFNLERRAFATLNCITVVPGAIGAWRKTDVEEAGYFQEDTLAEDTDITLTLLRNGKRIEFEEKAYAFTEAPEDIKSLAKQRYRWVYGTLQCLWKHRSALFSWKNKSLGYIALPNMWLFQYVYQTIAPLADILFILALFNTQPQKAAIGFILFYLLDLFAALYAFRLEKEDPKPLSSLFLQRILYKHLMTYVVIKSIFSALKGGTVGWGKLKRKGNATKENTIVEDAKETI